MAVTEDEKPLYLGHRERLRARFMVDEGASMEDYELLELLLTMAIVRKDVKPLAKRLIIKYGDIGGVIHAPAHELADFKGMTATAVVLLKVVSTCGIRCSAAGFCSSDKPIFTHFGEFVDYCRQKMAYEEVENFRVFCFDKNLCLLGEEFLSKGTANRTAVHAGEVLKTALKYKACFIVLVHNHPSGDSTPSSADKQVTANIATLCEAMDVTLYDHLVITRNDYFSFRNAGFIVSKHKQI
jgi:DNA repair protein RadC